MDGWSHSEEGEVEKMGARDQKQKPQSEERVTDCGKGTDRCSLSDRLLAGVVRLLNRYRQVLHLSVPVQQSNYTCQQQLQRVGEVQTGAVRLLERYGQVQLDCWRGTDRCNQSGVAKIRINLQKRVKWWETNIPNNIRSTIANRFSPPPPPAP